MKNRVRVSSVRTFVLVGACAFWGVVSFAVTRTYIGPENGKWNVAENWQDEGGAAGVPQAGDTLVIGTSSENDMETPSFARIAFAEGKTVTLTGNAFMLTSTTDDADAACAIWVPSTTTVNLYAPIASTVNNTIRGSGIVNQYVSFTCTGAIKPRKCYWHVWNCEAFAGTKGSFTFTCDAGGVRLHNATVSKTVMANGDTSFSDAKNALRAVEGENIVATAAGDNGNYPCALAGARLVIKEAKYKGYVRPTGEGTVVITNKPWTALSMLGDVTQNYNLEVHAAGNNFKQIAIPGQSTMKLFVEDALTVDGNATNKLALFGGTLDLNGHSQHCDGFFYYDYKGNVTKANAGTGTIRSASPATLSIVQRTPQMADETCWQGVFPYGGTLEGALSIAKSGAETTVLGGKGDVSTFAMSGSLSVEEGTLGLVKASFTGLADVSVADAATLAIGENVTIPATATLAVADGGTLQLDGDLSVGTGRVTVGGEVLPDGTYGASSSSARHADDAHFSGSGVLTVGAGDPVAKTTVWTGLAGTAKWSDSGNWSNGKPASGDTVTLVVPNALTTLVNDIEDLRLGAFSLTVGSDFEMTGNAIVVAEGGFSLTTSETSPEQPYEVAFDVPMTFVGDQVWEVATNATLRFKQSVEILADGTLTKNGMGALRFDAANVMSGAITVNYGNLKVYAPENGLGDGTATVEVYGTWNRSPRTHDAELDLCGATISNPLKIHDAASLEYASLRALSGANVVNGYVTTSGSWYPIVAEGASLTLAGGVSDARLLRACGSGTLCFDKTPVTIGSLTYYEDGKQALQVIVSTNVVFSTKTTTENDAKSHLVMRSADMTVTTTAPYVFDSRASSYPGNGYLNYFNGTFDVNGNSQCVGGFGVRDDGTKVKPENGTLTNSSDTPATLELYQQMYAANPIYGGKITGPLSIVKSGQHPLTLGLPATDAYAGRTAVFETSGDLCVTQGVLTVNAKARFSQVGAVRVSGSGTLNLEAVENLPKTVKLFYDTTEGASISVAAGVTLRVSEYWLNGVKQGPGSYVLGAGSVKVLGGGLILLFR